MIYMRSSKSKMMLLVGILVGVVTLSVALAAFSSTLTISPTANVTPSSADFGVKFSTVKATVTEGTLAATGGSSATLKGTTITGINANFTGSTSAVIYDFYVHNTGKYKAYLNSIVFGDKKCTPGTGATPALVTAACDGIKLTIAYGIGASSSGSSRYLQLTETNNSINGSYIDVGEALQVQVNISGNNKVADGPYTVNFGDIKFNYSTAD